MKDLIYDIETYKNLFSITFKNVDTGQIKVFEMSPWKNDWVEFRKFMNNCSNGFVRWVGFNNYGFDYPVVHFMVKNFRIDEADGAKLALMAHEKGTRIIKAPKDEKFQQIIWDNNQIVPQVDLFKIHHFDNQARSTSLKILQFNMRSENIQDLPYDPTKDLTYEQAREVLAYNIHDVEETYKFYKHSLKLIRFREELSEKYDKNFINYNDTKIGKEYLIMELEKAGVKCYTFDEDGRKPVQTKRPVIRLGDVVLSHVRFERDEFNAVKQWLTRQEIKQTKGAFNDIEDFKELEPYVNIENVKYWKRNKKGKLSGGKASKYKFPVDVTGNVEKIAYLRSVEEHEKVTLNHLHCVVNGFQYDFGTGGIHGSIDATIVEEDTLHAILDYDVTSLYPSLGIVNGLFPKHLTHKFCPIYAQLKEDRISYVKGTPENAVLKLGLNGAYGDSNNPYSPFFDPQYTMAITINGQLDLCMLAEMYMRVDGLKIIQINTDGISLKVKRDKIKDVEKLNRQWEHITKLDLERVDYKRMFIRDVNNYVAEYTNGELKRKGAYEYDVDWHQNHSALVVKKAVEAHLVHGTPVKEFIANHDDRFDFMLRMKVDRTSRLEWGGKQIQNTTRYYISQEGAPMVKIMPPLKTKLEAGERHFKQHKVTTAGEEQWKVTPVNKMPDELPTAIDHDWYAAEAMKLINPLYEGVLDDLMDYN